MKTNKNSRFKAIEKILLPRLQLLGFVMIAFSGLMFVYAYVSDPYVAPQNNLQTPESMEETSGIAAIDAPFFTLTDVERTWSYVVVGIFAVVGFGLIYFAKKKKAEVE